MAEQRYDEIFLLWLYRGGLGRLECIVGLIQVLSVGMLVYICLIGQGRIGLLSRGPVYRVYLVQGCLLMYALRVTVQVSLEGSLRPTDERITPFGISHTQLFEARLDRIAVLPTFSSLVMII